uniref:Metallothionein n=1 Tax=Bubo bubo TaxID=30461 RepID=A0A8C0FQ53_BUBBB
MWWWGVPTLHRVPLPHGTPIFSNPPLNSCVSPPGCCSCCPATCSNCARGCLCKEPASSKGSCCH